MNDYGSKIKRPHARRSAAPEADIKACLEARLLEAILQDGTFERPTEERRGTAQKGHRTYVYVRPAKPVGSDSDTSAAREA
jgi:hypothetical protein